MMTPSRTEPRERILVVEPDPEIADLIARQSLAPLRYRVKVVGEAGAALQESARFAPNLIIADLHLEGLSGKDLLAAFKAQGEDVPIIVIGTRGEEQEIIHAFRLGAADYLLWPMKETEVVTAVERVLKQVRERQTNKLLTQQLKRTNEELQKRVRELTTLFDLAKTVASATNQQVLFRRLVEGAIQVTDAEKGWMFLVDEKSRRPILVAHEGLPRSVAGLVGQPWDDGLSSLVMLSGEPLSIHGEPLKRFKIYRLGKSALVVPVKAKNEVIAILVVTRSSPKPFTPDEQALLEAIADYAAVALVNARLFKALEERAQALQQAADAARNSEKLKSEILRNISNELRPPLSVVQGYIDMLLQGQLGKLTTEQRKALQEAKAKLTQLINMVETMTSLRVSLAPGKTVTVDLAEIARLAIARHKPKAEEQGLEIIADFATEQAQVKGNPEQLAMVFDHLLSNAIKFTPKGGKITVRLQEERGNLIHVQVSDTGIGIATQHLPHVFERFYQADSKTTPRGGLGLGLSLVKQVVEGHGGRVWIESKKGKGTTVHVVLAKA